MLVAQASGSYRQKDKQQRALVQIEVQTDGLAILGPETLQAKDGRIPPSKHGNFIAKPCLTIFQAAACPRFDEGGWAYWLIFLSTLRCVEEDAEGTENTAASPGIQTESEEASSAIVDADGDDAAEDDPGALAMDEGLDVFVQRSSEAWVITPLSGHLRLELRPMPADGLPPAGSDGVIWRLDDKVLAQGMEEQWEDGEDFPSAARQDN
ncbi:unnamed protein product, partial [Symbiodinium necroappetens]